jgi:predicted  nucleic acid-binding Zn-ribbon protein
MDLKRALVDTERQIAERQKKLDTYPNQQSRMRENMKVLDRNSELYIDYAKRLKAQEQEIIALQDELDNLRKKQDEQRKALEDYLSSLSVG